MRTRSPRLQTVFYANLDTFNCMASYFLGRLKPVPVPETAGPISKKAKISWEERAEEAMRAISVSIFHLKACVHRVWPT